MQVVTSISLATSYSLDVLRPGTVPGCPEIALISSGPLLMASGLFQLYQETFELRCIGIGIGHRGRKGVRQIARGFAGVFLDPTVPEVDRYPDLKHLFAIDH